MIYCCIYLHHSISGALDGYIWNCCSWFSVQRSIPLWSYWVKVYRHFLHLPYAKPQSLWSAVEVFLQSPWKWKLPVPDILQLCLSAVDERRRTSFQKTTHCESKEDRGEIFVWQVRPRNDGCFLSMKWWPSFGIGVERKKGAKSAIAWALDSHFRVLFCLPVGVVAGYFREFNQRQEDTRQKNAPTALNSEYTTEESAEIIDYELAKRIQP